MSNKQALVNNSKGYDGIPDCLSSLHQTRPTQVGFIQSRTEHFTPKTSLDGASFFKFSISGGQDEFIDVAETKIWLTLKVTKNDGTDLVAGEAASNMLLVNSIGTALFKNLNVRLNNQPISVEDGFYAHKADFENRFFTPQTDKSGNLTLAGYFEEESSFNDVDDGDRARIWNPGNPWDKAWITRQSMIALSRQVEICSRLYSPIFDQGKPLPPFSQLDLDFQRNSDEFCLLTHAAAGGKVAVTSFTIEAQFLKADTEIVHDIMEIAAKDPYKYQLRHVKVFPFPFGNGVLDLSCYNVFGMKQPIPRKVFVAIINQHALYGAFGLDPFAYPHYHRSHVRLVIGGQPRPKAELTSPLQELCALQSACEAYLGGEWNGLGRLNYATRNAVFGWDLSPTGEAPLESFTMLCTENVNIEIKLSEPTPTPVTVFVYGEYENELLLDVSGNVLNTTEFTT